MTRRLAGKTAVISGASSGIGQAVACRFAAEGAAVAIVDIASADETVEKIGALGGRCLPVRCDISDAGAVAACAEEISADLGLADILVNNAAVQDMIPFDELSFDDWQRFMSVNLNGIFLMTKAFADDLKRSSAGRVINFSSTSIWVNVPNFVHYITTKAGIIGFTNSLATEFGRYGITVNAIAPSLVRTPGTSHRDTAEDDYALLASLQVINREQMPDDITGTALFLASDDAAFVTGQVLVVDGGLTRR